MTTQTNGDELERKEFEKWCSSEYPKLDGEIVMGNDVALIAKSIAWDAWLSRSKQEQL